MCNTSATGHHTLCGYDVLVVLTWGIGGKERTCKNVYDDSVYPVRVYIIVVSTWETGNWTGTGAECARALGNPPPGVSAPCGGELSRPIPILSDLPLQKVRSAPGVGADWQSEPRAPALSAPRAATPRWWRLAGHRPLHAVEYLKRGEEEDGLYSHIYRKRNEEEKIR